MVDGVGDDHGAVREQGEPLRLLEAGPAGRAVHQTPLTAAEPPEGRLPVLRQLHHLVPGGVRDEERPRRQPQHLAGEAEHRRLRLRRRVREAAAPEGALRRVLGLQLRHQPLDLGHVPLTRVRGHDVPLRVDDHQRRPRLHRVLVPRRQLGVVQDGMRDRVPLHGVRHRRVLRLVRELRRVHADHHERVPVPLLQLTQLVDDVQAVDAGERPEVEQHHASAQAGEGVPGAARVEPAALPRELGRPHACGAADGGAGRRRPYVQRATGEAGRGGRRLRPSG